MLPGGRGYTIIGWARVRPVLLTQLGEISPGSLDAELANQIVNANLASATSLIVHMTKMAGQTVCSHLRAALWAFLEIPASHRTTP
jgi:hypothetical protein